MPLTAGVAEALLAYLNDRSPAEYPYLFLSLTKPRRPLGKGYIPGDEIARYYQKAGVNAKGSHAIRHSFATRLVQHGTPIKTIADLPGPSCINTTFVYTRVDVEQLRQMSGEWPIRAFGQEERRTNRPFNSELVKHLELRRSMGQLLKGDEYVLKQFDQFARLHSPEAATLTRDLVVGFLDQNKHLSPTTRVHKVATLRQFARYLFQLDPETYIPERSLVPARHFFLPHIYSLAGNAGTHETCGEVAAGRFAAPADHGGCNRAALGEGLAARGSYRRQRDGRGHLVGPLGFRSHCDKEWLSGC